MNIPASIPKNRLVLYLIAAGVIPLFFVWVIFSSELSELANLENHMFRLQDMAFSTEKKQSINMAVRNHFKEADHFYIDKHIETIALMQPEIESLKGVLNNPNLPDDEGIKKRLELLSGPTNKLVFAEGVVQSTPQLQEVTETLTHPVEVNVSDLRQILCKVEEIPFAGCEIVKSRPQLIVLDFKIEKKNVSEKNQVFVLNLKLLKREFL